MTNDVTADICVIGAGSGGLAVAAGAAQMGASTVLIEKGRMGGDCLNYGCVPSKALLAAGHAARAIRDGHRYGVHGGEARIDADGVFRHVHGAIAAIEPMDSVERFEGLGVKVIGDEARFGGPGEVAAGNHRVRARRFVVATGSTPFVPPIPGLDRVPVLTNETLFYSGRLPRHLIVIGGGPIGMEMAQAHRDLGAEVTLLEMFDVMPADDPELVAVVRDRMIGDGVDIRERVRVKSVDAAGDAVTVVVEENGAESRVSGTDILMATGRRPTIDGLDLDAAGIAHSETGIQVDDRLRTTNRKVFAIGDCAGGYQFTHVAGYHAGIVLRNALFRLPARVDDRAVPWVTYTRPELAQVGLTEKRAKERGGAIRVLRWPFHDIDRSTAEGDTEGAAKVITSPRGHILGCGIVGAHAGELIHTWVMAMSQGLKIGAIARMIAPYPTRGEISKRVAGTFYTPTLFGERTRRIVRFLARFG